IAAGAGAAGVLNMWYDADIDAVMARTARRPIPRGRISRAEALTFGVILAGSAVAVLALALNVQAAALLAFTIFFYVVVYTISLLPWASGFAGAIYAAAALVSGTILVALAFRLHRRSNAEPRDASRLFAFSIFYLSVLFAALLADHSGDRRSSTSPAQTVST